MKKILGALLIAATMFGTADAQTTPPPVAMKKDKMEKGKKEAELNEAFAKANLTADEQAQCRAVLEASAKENKALRADAGLSEADKKAKMDAGNKAKNEKLKSIMGAAKYKDFKAAQKAQKEAAEKDS